MLNRTFVNLLQTILIIMYRSLKRYCYFLRLIALISVYYTAFLLNRKAFASFQLCPPVDLILSLYSAALYLKSTVPFSQTGDNTPISSYATILGSRKLQSLIATIETLSSYFPEKQGDGNVSGLFLPYLDALEFSCQVLLPCAKAGWRHFCSEGKDFPNSYNWSNISKVLQAFCSCAVNAFR